MRSEFISIILPEGQYQVEVLIFDESDRDHLGEIYREWRSLSTKLIEIGGRGVNLPEALSENAFCLETGAVRIKGSIQDANTSFDCYRNGNRIQLKACSVLPDLTSFGPRSVWDELYFLDFFRQGNWDGTFDIYLLENELIYNYPVNQDQTLRDQQNQGRRPRFSIYRGIIQPNNIQPIRTGRLW